MIEQFYSTHIIGTTDPGQSEPDSNSNEEILHIFKSSWTEASSSDAI